MKAVFWISQTIMPNMKTSPQAEGHAMILQASAAADDSFGSLLLLKSSMPSRSAPKGVLPRAGCSLQLQLDLSWPLTAFLPPVRLCCAFVDDERPSQDASIVRNSARQYIKTFLKLSLLISWSVVFISINELLKYQIPVHTCS